MKKIILTVLFSLLLLGGLQSQSKMVSPQYISYKDKEMEVNLPQFGVSIKLPPNMGVEFPVIRGKNVSLAIDLQSYFSFDLEYLKSTKTNTFKFAMPGEYDTPLWMNITLAYQQILEIAQEKNSSEAVNQYLKDFTFQSRLFIKPIKSKIGESVGTIYKSNSNQFETHTIYYNGYLFTFYILDYTSPKQKKHYENIIKSFGSKDLTAEKEKYEQRVKYGYYTKENRNDKIEQIDDNTFQKFKGTTSESTTFDYPYPGVSIQIPSGFKYEVGGRYMTNKDSNVKEVLINGIDLYNEKIISFNYIGKNFTFTNRIMDNNDANLQELIETSTNNYRHVQWAKTSINNIPAVVALSGGDAGGNLDLALNLDDKVLWISIWGYNNKTKDEIDKIVSTLKVKNNTANSTPAKAQQPLFSSLFKIKALSNIKLDNIVLPIPDTSDCDKWEITDLGLSFFLHGKVSDYTKRVNGNTETVENGKITKEIPLNEDQSFHIADNTHTSILDISVAEAPKNQEEALREAKYAWENYKSISILKAGIVVINDIKWSILICKQTDRYMAFATSFRNGYKIELSTFVGSSFEDMYQQLGYLNTFKF